MYRELSEEELRDINNHVKSIDKVIQKDNAFIPFSDHEYVEKEEKIDYSTHLKFKKSQKMGFVFLKRKS